MYFMICYVECHYADSYETACCIAECHYFEYNGAPKTLQYPKIKENHESYHILTPQQFFHKLLKGRLYLKFIKVF